MSKAVIVGISGASGFVYGVRALDVLHLEIARAERWQGA